MNANILRRNKDFRHLYARGKAQMNRVLITYVMKNRKGTTRIGITASKKVGNAVKRNRARRIIREAYRALDLDFSMGYDIVFVARAKTHTIKMTELLPVMRKQLTAAGVLK